MALVALAFAGCSTFTAPETPASSCRGRKCETAVKRAARDFHCPAASMLVREHGGGRLIATGCGKQADYACSRSSCGRRGDVRSIDAETEVRYRASLELSCQRSEIELVPRDAAFDASCRGATLHFVCEARGCHSTGSPDPMLLYLRQREAAVIDCVDRSPTSLEISFDGQGRIVRVSGEGFPTAHLRGTVPHGQQDTSARGCITKEFANAPRDPARAGTTLVVAYGERGVAPISTDSDEADGDSP